MLIENTNGWEQLDQLKCIIIWKIVDQLGEAMHNVSKLSLFVMSDNGIWLM